MGRIRPIVGALLLFPFLILAGCATMDSLNETRAYEAAILAGKLTRTVQTVIVMPENGPVPEDRILEEAFNERPELRRYFQGLPIYIKHNRGDVVLLVCSPDGKYAWIEDASWTTQVDNEWYLTEPTHPPVFTMDPSTGSRGPAE